MVDGSGTYTQTGTGAVTRSVQARLQEVISVKDFGATGEGLVDDTAAIEAAHDAALVDGRSLFFPPGTYLATLAKTVCTEGGPMSCSFQAASGMSWIGVRGKSIIKLKDGESTDVSPKYFSLIVGNSVIDHLNLEGLTFDLNGQNNRINPRRYRSSTVTVTSASPAVVTWTNHGLLANEKFFFTSTTGALPAGLTILRPYYVKTVLTANTFTISAAAGGTAIDTGGSQSGMHQGTGGSYTFFNCAALMISGSVATVGADARLNRAKILNCEFVNGPGVSTLVLAQTNANSDGLSAGSVLGDDIEIAGCRFHDNGLDCDDHSTIFGWANNVRVHHNVFSASLPSSGVQGPLAAMELHGSDTWFTHNKVFNYAWGVYFADNFTERVRGQYVTDNSFIVTKKACRAWVELSTSPGIEIVRFSRNRVWLIDAFPGEFDGDGSQIKKAIDFRPSYGAIYDYQIDANIITNLDTFAAWGIVIASIAANTAISNGKCYANTLGGFSDSIVVGGGDGFVFELDCDENLITDVRPTEVNTNTIGIYHLGQSGAVRIRNNSVRRGPAGSSGHPEYGLYLTGSAMDLDMDGNNAEGDAVAGIFDAIAVSGRRTGRQARTFNGVPTQSTWKIGDQTENLAAAALLGSAPNRYTVRGYTRITNGSGNALNTDWVEQRCPTGT